VTHRVRQRTRTEFALDVVECIEVPNANCALDISQVLTTARANTRSVLMTARCNKHDPLTAVASDQLDDKKKHMPGAE